MSIKEYFGSLANGRCYLCRTIENVVADEDGDEICIDCLFEIECEKEWTDVEK